MTSQINFPPPQKNALVVAHPGHVMKMYGLLRAAKPLVFILTDGSGSRGASKLEEIRKAIEEVGARIGSIFGRYTDIEIYSFMLDGRSEIFVELAEELTRKFEEDGTALVAADALEGYNPAHDLCRMITGACVEIIGRKSRRELLNYDFSLETPDDENMLKKDAKAIHLKLDNGFHQRKCAYGLQFYADFFKKRGLEAQKKLDGYREEWLRPCENQYGYAMPPDYKPFYESYGEKQVADGIYKNVIRYREHILPIGNALWDFAERAAEKVKAAR